MQKTLFEKELERMIISEERLSESAKRYGDTELKEWHNTRLCTLQTVLKTYRECRSNEFRYVG